MRAALTALANCNQLRVAQLLEKKLPMRSFLLIDNRDVGRLVTIDGLFHETPVFVAALR